LMLSLEELRCYFIMGKLLKTSHCRRARNRPDFGIVCWLFDAEVTIESCSIIACIIPKKTITDFKGRVC
jgi:hypothetical protein